MKTTSVGPTFALDPAPQGLTDLIVTAPVLRPGRAIHPVDVANLNEGPGGHYGKVAMTWQQQATPSSADLVVVAVPSQSAFAVRTASTSARLVTPRGWGATAASLAATMDGLPGTRFPIVILAPGAASWPTQLTGSSS